ncbi:MAG: hypothetical protein KFB95_06725 [Simkaniaceae bacterium]|nr:MAG: hypothetical protein KFB95_06725 [Simkaniaceae bacterium]
MITSAVQGFQNNRYHAQEVVGSLFAAALVKLGSKHIQQITNLTAFASAANGASVLVTAKSAHTLWTSNDADEKSAAKKALALALTTATVTTLLRGTTILKTRHTSLPALSEFAKPLAAATAATAVLTAGGIKGIKVAHGAVTTWQANRALAAAAEKLAAAKIEIVKEAFDSEDKINALEAPVIQALADHVRVVLGSDTDKADVSDDLIAWVNAKVAALNHAQADTIPNWVDLAK